MRPYGKFTVRHRVALPRVEDGVTQQQFRDSSDVNNIVAKYQGTGLLEASRPPAGAADFGYAPSQSYFEALCVHRAHRHTVAAAEAALQELQKEAIATAGVPADVASTASTGGHSAPAGA